MHGFTDGWKVLVSAIHALVVLGLVLFFSFKMRNQEPRLSSWQLDMHNISTTMGCGRWLGLTFWDVGSSIVASLLCTEPMD